MVKASSLPTGHSRVQVVSPTQIYHLCIQTVDVVSECSGAVALLRDVAVGIGAVGSGKMPQQMLRNVREFHNVPKNFPNALHC